MAATNFGRYVCQLRKLRITFCKGGGSSTGMREYIEYSLPEYAQRNQQTVFHVEHRGGRHPVVEAEFCIASFDDSHDAHVFTVNGKKKRVCVRNKVPEEIETCVDALMRQEGLKASRYKVAHKSRQSVQGNWNPFLH